MSNQTMADREIGHTTMTAQRRCDSGRQWIIRGVVGVTFLGIGAASSWLYLRDVDHTAHAGASEVTNPHRGHTTAEAGPPRDADSSDPDVRAPRPDVELTLSEQAAKKAGIEIATITKRPAGHTIRVPGTIEPNGYRTVTITPLVAGRVQHVAVQLGDRVRAGQTLATVFSPDLADAQSRYLSMRAALEAEHQRLQRTLRLIDIGAASQQELEEVRARHTTYATDVEGARARLALLGLSQARLSALSRPDDISALVSVPAPVSGEVVAREANPGAVVDQSSTLFTVTDLSTVWVIGAVYERDFPALRIGSPAVVMTPAFPGLEIRGRVNYLAPRIDEQTRTAQVRVEIPNAERRLRLRMYVDVRVGPTDAQPAAVVPTEAVQTIGDRTVVYLVKPQQAGRFTEREVQLGERLGKDVKVIQGLQPGDTVVVKGSFALRAERERTGGTPSAHADHGSAAPAVGGHATMTGNR